MSGCRGKRGEGGEGNKRPSLTKGKSFFIERNN